MSDDYTRGHSGAPPGIDADMAEYQRGRSDQLAGRIDLAHRGMDLTGVSDAGRQVGREWREDPNKTLRQMLMVLLGTTVVGGLIGFGLASFLGRSWTPSPTAWAIQGAAIAFWLDGALTWGLLGGSLIGGRKTLRGFLVWLVLTVVLGFMLWTFVLNPMFRGFTN